MGTGLNRTSPSFSFPKPVASIGKRRHNRRLHRARRVPRNRQKIPGPRGKKKLSHPRHVRACPHLSASQCPVGFNSMIRCCLGATRWLIVTGARSGSAAHERLLPEIGVLLLLLSNTRGAPSALRSLPLAASTTTCTPCAAVLTVGRTRCVCVSACGSHGRRQKG